MRAVPKALAVVGGCVLTVTLVVCAWLDRTSEIGWLLVGPLPFLLVGIVAVTRRPDHRGVWWLLCVGVVFVVSSAVGEVYVPLAVRYGVPSAGVTALGLVLQWTQVGLVFAGMCVIGLFPSGRPERAGERVVIWSAGSVGLLVPLLNAVAAGRLLAASPPASGPVLPSALHVHGLAPVGAVSSAVYVAYPAVIALGLVLLAVRYRYADPTRSRQIRWMLFGCTVSVLVGWLPLSIVTFGNPDSGLAKVGAGVFGTIGIVTALGSMLVALLHDGVFGIDRLARRMLAGRVLRVGIAGVTAVLAIVAGMLAARVAPPLVAVAVAVAATVAGQPLRRRVEGLLDRWVFDARLSGYASLNRFGEALARSPGPDDVLRDLAAAVRRGLQTTWVRAVLDPLPSSTDGTPAGEPAAAVPIVHAGATLGRIECGPRPDGPLLEEDRRLLGYFAAQTAAAVHNLYLAAELSERVEVIGRQAAELSASRDRVVAGQDAERRRIQRVLHDGVQQEIVALSAKVALIEQRTRRGTPPEAAALAELGRDLGALLHGVRDIAYAIHPPVLSDRGLLAAVEAQASRITVSMVVRADPSLRGVRFAPPVEAAAWYAVAEALANVVKHAGATEVEVSLDRFDGRLAVAVHDNGHGFDPAGPRGLGLIGLADRLDVVGGSLRLRSGAGVGTSVCVEIPCAPRAGRQAHDG